MPPPVPSYSNADIIDVQRDVTKENMRLHDTYLLGKLSNEWIEHPDRLWYETVETWVNHSNECKKNVLPVLFERKMPTNDAYEGNHDQSLDYYGKSPWFSSQELEI